MRTRVSRRQFLQSSVGAAVAWPAHAARAQPASARGWRTFEVTTRIEVLRPSGTTRIWVPAPLIVETPYQRSLSTVFDAPGGMARLVQAQPDALGIVAAEFAPAVKPVLTVTSRIATRDHVVDLSAPSATPRRGLDRSALAHFLRPTKLIPTDGIVRSTALEITRDARNDLEKARAIYEWIVEHTFRDPKVQGCGLGDIRFMLESRNLGGKCADLNALFVGLARAVGVPARDVYGIRVAPSRLGYRSLGAATGTVTRAQHCRAEVYVEEYGWVPVDPADVRKVALEEPPGNLPLEAEVVRQARQRLFGSWEMNWIAYNFAHDVVLPGSERSPIAFLMYPQAETADGRIDSLDPANFSYEIVANEITVTRGPL